VRVALAVSCLAALGFAVPGTAADERRIRGYCSPSGDLCYGIFNDSGTIRFQLTLVERYFTRYRICVRPPTGATTCRSFPVKKTGATYGGAVRWQRNFPARGPGVYRVRWRLGTQALGPALTFSQS
jgi:hypothetical protein